jgi:hypothetical protein
MKIVKVVAASLGKSVIAEFKDMLRMDPHREIHEFYLPHMDIADVNDFVERELRRRCAYEGTRSIVVHGVYKAQPAVVQSFAGNVLMRPGLGDNVEVFILVQEPQDFEKYFPLECFLDSPSAVCNTYAMEV